MYNKYFNVVVKPTITASLQAANSGVYASGDVVFDWHGVDVPKGASRLVGITAVIRQKHGTAANEFPFQLIYGKSINSVAPTSLGVSNATAGGVGYYNNVIGKSTFIAKDYMGDVLDNGVTVAALTQGGADSESPSIVLEGEPDSGTNVGYDKIYVAMITEGAFDFSTGVAITSAGFDSSAGDGTISVFDGTDPTLVFAPGDVLHAQDNVVCGEVASIAAAGAASAAITFQFSGGDTLSETDYTVPANLEAWIEDFKGEDLAEDDELFNVNPVKITLHFEK
jgi:hypothetical protein